MNIIVACDSFKGSLSSAEAGRACSDGIAGVLPDARVTVVEVADGGEGTAAALTRSLGGSFVNCRVNGPLGEPVVASYGISPDGKTAIMEMAQASGLTLVDPAMRNPLEASSFGTGQMIADAISRGCSGILLGIGGSATVDGGTGMLAALGVRFHDKEGRELPGCGRSLELIDRIDFSGLTTGLRHTRLTVACDVDNPLCGPRGARVFAPQKGAGPAMVARLEKGLENYAGALRRATGRNIASSAGAGAAGGLGAALMALPGVRIVPGIDMVLDTIGFNDLLKGADLVITGEGRIDSQTLMGKVPAGVLRAAQKAGVPVVAIGGSAEVAPDLLKAGFSAIFAAVTAPVSLAEAMAAPAATRNLSFTAGQVVKLFATAKQSLTTN